MSIALALLAASTPQAAQLPQIALHDRNIRAGDLAVIAGREDAVLAALPKGQDTVKIDVEAARRLLTNRLPGSAFTLRFSSSVTLAAPAQSPRNGTCFAAHNDINSGALVMEADVRETACSDEKRAAGLAYDRNRKAPMAKRGISSGAYLGQVKPAREAVTGKGSRVTFRTAAGPVMIERSVEVLQPARAGERVFARTEDGEVISAPLIGDQETPE
ncbi:hypothetical protein [Qipengyuania sp. DGS5-3]|uniref:hypothetical protein n=1 Tax=Qipengyuania sp. DGS5-3 TaxID=3349632 RepID=UPI0036D27056